MKIGLLSDVHAAPDPVQEALALFEEHQVDTILCAGDIAGYGERLDETIELLVASNCQSVLGNHDLWYCEKHDLEAEVTTTDFLRSLPIKIEIDIGDVHLNMIHASPFGELLNGIRLLDEEGKPIRKQLAYWTETLDEYPADILVVGHTHQVFAQQLGDLLVVNPGSTLFNHTCAMLTLPEKEVEFFALSGKDPLLSWNFSLFKDMCW